MLRLIELLDFIRFTLEILNVICHRQKFTSSSQILVTEKLVGGKPDIQLMSQRWL